MRWTIIPLVVLGACNDPAKGSDLTAIFEGIVRDRASVEFPCPVNQLSVDNLEGAAYRVTGCGDYATYECEYNVDNNDDTIYVCKRAAADEPEHLDAGM